MDDLAAIHFVIRDTLVRESLGLTIKCPTFPLNKLLSYVTVMLDFVVKQSFGILS